jgi:hypothetical protein
MIAGFWSINLEHKPTKYWVVFWISSLSDPHADKHSVTFSTKFLSGQKQEESALEVHLVVKSQVLRHFGSVEGQLVAGSDGAAGTGTAGMEGMGTPLMEVRSGLP